MIQNLGFPIGTKFRHENIEKFKNSAQNFYQDSYIKNEILNDRVNFLKFRYHGWRGKKGFQTFKIHVLLFACNIFLETFFGEENV